MVSKIIQKEKERQEVILKVINSKEKLQDITVGKFCAMMNKKFCHKQSLINLKEYLEGQLIALKLIKELEGTIGLHSLKEDIKELSKMIRRYG